MGLIIWDEIYRVGHETVDQQHQQLFAIVNRFHDAWQQRRDRAELRRIFDEIVEYTVYHFAEEERVMGDVGYADVPRHRGYHDKLKQVALSYRRLLDTREEDVEARIVAFLKMWLNAHVLGADKEICGQRPRR
jgi:hemerythrin